MGLGDVKPKVNFCIMVIDTNVDYDIIMLVIMNHVNTNRDTIQYVSLHG